MVKIQEFPPVQNIYRRKKDCKATPKALFNKDTEVNLLASRKLYIKKKIRFYGHCKGNVEFILRLVKV